MNPREVKSIFGNKVRHYDCIFHSYVDEKRIISLKEVSFASSLFLKGDEIKSFEDIKKNIGKIGLFRHEIRFGNSFNNIDTPSSFGGMNTYKTYDVTSGKFQALNYIGSPNSDYIYGSYFVVNSSFILLSTASANLRRTFEADKCNSSSDIYFSHDLEGCIEVMFSQHLRNKNYVIGNLELSKDHYLEIKETLIEQLNEKLSSNKKLDFSVWGF